ncbi:MAG: hypothetical protein V3V08_14900 [Nannocystaceae bacterium]
MPAADAATNRRPARLSSAFPRSPGAREFLRLAIAGTVIAGVVAAIVVPHVKARWYLSPDAIEHLSIARQWVDGSGFFNGVRSYFFLEHKLPIPGIAVRAPGISVLLAIPMALGATLNGVLLFHCLAASVIAGAGVLAARTVASFWAAVAGAMAIALSPAWLNLSRYVWSEALSFGCFIAILLSARGVLRSHTGAVLCGMVCVIAWLARPQFAAMPIALAAATLLELGLRRGLRHTPLWSFLATFLATQMLVRQITVGLTGLTPYQGYGMTTQIFGSGDLFYYQREFAGTTAFLRSQSARVWEVVLARPGELGRTLFLESGFHWVGWLGLPATVYCIFGRRQKCPHILAQAQGQDRSQNQNHQHDPNPPRARGGLERRLLGLAVFGYSAVIILNYSAYDPKRYPLIVAAAGWLCTVAMLSDAANWLSLRWTPRSARARICSVLPFACVAGLVATTTLGDTLRVRNDALIESAAHDTRQTYRAQDASFRRFCHDMTRGVPVAVSRNLMWAMHLWCGNPGVNLPFDLRDEKWQKRFIEEEGIHYIIARDRKKPFRWLIKSKLVQKVRRQGAYTLYRVRAPTDPATLWTPAPPIVCIGHSDDCARAQPFDGE